MRRLVIVGGGITGLAAAYRLKTQTSQLPSPPEIHLIEASDRLGGILHTTQRDGFILEGGPDCFLSEKLPALELCRQLGLMDQLISTRTENRRSFIVRHGKLHPIPKGFYLIAPSRLRPFLSSSLLSWRGKWRVLMEALLPAQKSPPLKKGGQGGFGRTAKSLPTSLFQREESHIYDENDESLASFVRRRLGQETLDWLAQPILAGIYAADPETLSLHATFPTFLEMEEKYGSVLVGLKKRGAATKQASGARYSLFASLRDGMQTLADALVKQLPPSIIRLNTQVIGLRPPSPLPSPTWGEGVFKKSPLPTEGEVQGEGAGVGTRRNWQLKLSNGETLEADAVCLALPAYRCAEFLSEQNPSLADLLNDIPYSGSATLNFAFRETDIPHPLNGFGFVTPWAEKRKTLACTFVHKKFAGRAPSGHALLRVFMGGALQENLLTLDDSELEKYALADLKDILGVTSRPLFSVIERWPRAMPQYTLGHVHRVLEIEERLLGMPGLSLAGNWLRGVGIPDCVESGHRAADQMLRYLDTKKIVVEKAI